MTERTSHFSGPFQGFREKEDAIAFLQKLKCEALANKRAYGLTHNPFRAVPGMEKEFEDAENTIRYCDRILKEIEKAPELQRRKRAAVRFTKGATDRYIIIVFGISIVGLGITGSLLLCSMLHIKPIFLLVGAAAVAISAELWNALRTRK